MQQDPDYLVPSFPPERCAAYLAGTEGSAPRPQLVAAIEFLAQSKKRCALDIGCGPGREVLVLLRAGFRVTAVDPYRTMLDRTRALVAAEAEPSLESLVLRHATIESIAPELGIAAFGLVHAGFVLPFVVPAHFDMVFDAIERSLVEGGVLAAQFFGPDDEFVRTAAPGTMTSHTAAQLDALLTGFEILSREEHNRAGCIGRGREKWWHVHHVVARKRAVGQARPAEEVH